MRARLVFGALRYTVFVESLAFAKDNAGTVGIRSHAKHCALSRRLHDGQLFLDSLLAPPHGPRWVSKITANSQWCFDRFQSLATKCELWMAPWGAFGLNVVSSKVIIFVRLINYQCSFKFFICHRKNSPSSPSLVSIKIYREQSMTFRLSFSVTNPINHRYQGSFDLVCDSDDKIQYRQIETDFAGKWAPFHPPKYIWY